MIPVLENEVEPDKRGLAEAIAELLPRAEYRDFVADPGPVDLAGIEGLVITGSTAGVYEKEHEDWIAPERRAVRRCRDRGIPVLGVCFGHQLVNDAFGGRVEHDGMRKRLVRMTDYERTGVLEGVEPVVPVLHGDLVVELGDGMRTVARTEYDPHFCTVHEEAPIYTVQFHPEFTEAFAEGVEWGFETGEFSFSESTAPRVFETFADICARELDGSGELSPEPDAAG